MKGALRKQLEERIGQFEQSALRYTQAPKTSGTALHDLRVALRRVRAGVRILRKADGAPHLRRLTSDLRSLARVTGTARDEEVLERIMPISPVVRRRVTKTLLTRLRRLNPEKLADKMREEVGEQLRDSSATDIITAARKAADRDRRKLARAAASSWVLVRNSDELHRYRIRAKKLRYTIELFERELPRGCRSLHELAKRTQDALGKVHDLDMAIELASHQRRRGKERQLDRLRQRRERAISDAVGVVEKFRSAL